MAQMVQAGGGSRQPSTAGQQQEGSFIKVTQRWASGLAGAGSFLARGPHGAPKALCISFIIILRITKVWQVQFNFLDISH